MTLLTLEWKKPKISTCYLIGITCLEVIERGLGQSNVIGPLVDSDSLGLDSLKNICMEYVVLNYGKAIHEEDGLEPLSHSLLLELRGEITEKHF